MAAFYHVACVLLVTCNKKSSVDKTLDFSFG